MKKESEKVEIIKDEFETLVNDFIYNCGWTRHDAEIEANKILESEKLPLKPF